MPVGNGDVEAWNVRPVLCVLVSGAIPLPKEFLDKRSRVRRWHVPNVGIAAETAEMSKVLQVTVPIFGDAPSFVAPTRKGFALGSRLQLAVRVNERYRLTVLSADTDVTTCSYMTD